jgi:catechol 2,3-dioxygenase-like lactoylglutathione lyase family enzyme
LANNAIKALGELAIRCEDLPKMTAFYRDVVGLDVYRDDVEGVVFLEIAPALEGHPQLIALFDRPIPPGQERGRLDHFAFAIDLTDYDAEKGRLEAAGVNVFVRTIDGFGWRSIFFPDPEGNVVEFVAHDPTVP